MTDSATFWLIGSVKWIITNIFDTENAAWVLLNVIRIIGRGLFSDEMLSFLGDSKHRGSLISGDEFDNA